MTKKDFAAVAKILASSRPRDTGDEPSREWETWNRVRYYLAEYFETVNPRFDRKKFYQATEL